MSVPRPVPPPNAWRRALWSSVRWASLDFQATGLDLTRDQIISFGVVPIRGTRIEVGEAVYRLVDPGDVLVSPESVTIHGLRPVDLVGAPSVETAKQVLADAIGGSFLVTWWAGVTAAFLDKLYGGGRKTWLKRAIDVRKLLMELDGADAEGRSLVEAAERFGVPVASPHHALDDALVTAQLFLVAATKLSIGRPRTFRDLAGLGPHEPPRLRRPRAFA